MKATYDAQKFSYISIPETSLLSIMYVENSISKRTFYKK